jgi:hypothetical protein
MTINSTTRKAGPFTGTGTVLAFPFGFKVFQASDLFVVRLDVSASVEQTLVLNANYSVTLNPDQNSNPGGIVTLTAPLATGYTLTLTSDVPDTQPTDLTNQGGFYPEVINDALDRATIQIQQVQEEIDRTITAPISTPSGTDLTFPLPNANKFIGWNSTATALQNLDDSTLASIVAFATAYADTFDGDGVTSTFALSYPPATVRNLDVSINGVTQVPVVDYDIAGQALNLTTPPPLGSVLLAKYWQALPNSSGAAQDFTLTPNGYTTAVDVQEGFDNLGSSAGASKVGFIQAGTGAQARPTQAKLRDTVSVKDFGAVCDGVTDDAVAIQAAIDYANSIGGAVVTADGVCKVATTVTVTQNVKFIFNDLIPSTSSTNVLRIYGGCSVQGRVNTTAFPTYSGNAVTIDGNGENLGSIFRLDRQTDLDLVVKGGGDTGTAIYFKATDTKAWIMNVNLQADINKFRYGIRMEQTSTDLSKFITSNTIQASTSETLTALSMVSSHPNRYGLDGNNIYIKGQPKPGTTLPLFDICGQANVFDLTPWDWDTVVGTAPYAMEIQPFTRNSGITWRTDWNYLDNSSTDASLVFTVLFDLGGMRLPRLYTSRIDNTLPILDTNTVLSNNRYYACKTTTNVDAPVLGLNASNDLLIQATTVAGSDILMDTRNATGIYAFRINAANQFFITPTHIAPGSDNALSNGTVSARWSVVYAVTPTINTSDARLKQDVERLDAVEKRVAIALKGLIRKFRFKDAVEKKGEEARIHTGVIAQEVEAAFAAEGLDARRYGLLCYDELEEGDIYGIRYDELAMFILGAI